jgi:hypothetical protein
MNPTAQEQHDPAGDEQEPDYRFTFANERTFLAWIRTALALIAGGVAVASSGGHGGASAAPMCCGRGTCSRAWCPQNSSSPPVRSSARTFAGALQRSQQSWLVSTGGTIVVIISSRCLE